MSKLRLLVGMASVLLVLGVVVSAALADAPGAGTCSGGTIAAGTYNGLTVTGDCTFADGATITIDGNLTVADGSVLNAHAASTATVHVNGNVRVGKGAILGLGTYNPRAVHDSTVSGNIIANQPISLYLSFLAVEGNVVSNGGGTSEFLNMPIKDNTIGGNLIVHGYQGGWLGLIRNHVGGNVDFSNNVSVVTETGPGVDPDANEVQTNTIAGDLICHGNTPNAQVNPDDGGQPNMVGGQKIGECAGL